MSFITDNFELLTETSHSIDQLKQLVLDLAVRGRLVTQYPSDNSIHALLEEFLKKRKIRKNGGIQLRKPPFAIPKNWAWTNFIQLKLDAFTGLEKSRKFQSEHYEFEYFKMNNIGMNGECLTEDMTRVDATKKEVEKYSLNNGDFLFNTRNSVALVGKTCVFSRIDNAITLFNNNILKVVFPPFVSSDFINYWFVSPSGRLLIDPLKSATTNVAAIYQKKLDSFYIPLPPLPEQHRIVQKVNTLFQQIDQLAEQSGRSEATRQQLRVALLHRLEQAPDRRATATAWQPLAEQFDLAIRTRDDVQALRQTILQLAVKGALVPQDPGDEPAGELLKRIKIEKERLVKVGEIRKEKGLSAVRKEDVPFEVPAGWVWCRLGELTRSLTNGLYKPSKFYTKAGILSLRMYNIQDGQIDFKDCKRVEVTPEEYEKYKLEENDILINRVNSAELVGKAAIIEFNRERMVYESMNIRLSLFEKEDTATYINLFLKSSFAKSYFLFENKQAISQASINQQQVSNLPISLPPLPEQRRIVQKVEALLGWCDDLEAGLEEMGLVEERLVGAALKV